MIIHVKKLQALNILTLLGVLTANFLANFLPINGQTTGEVSAQYENLFTPAGYTFAIWSVIYLGLIAFIIYQSQGLFGGNMRERPVAAQLGIAFFINGIANIAWILAWHHQQFKLTLILMAVILLSLIDINQRLFRAVPGKNKGGTYHWSVRIPFGIYLGWICVATIANIAVYLVYKGWSGYGISETAWTIITLGLSSVVGIWLVARMRLIPAAVAIAWGIAGVLVNLWMKNVSHYLLLAAAIALLVLGISLIKAFRKKKK